jgi:YVTN family beta-propeller protein
MSEAETAGHVLVVLHKLGASLAMYDVQRGVPLIEQQTRPFPHELCASPDGRSLVVAEYGLRGTDTAGAGGTTLGVFDLRTGRRTATLSTEPYDRPHGISAAANGVSRLFVTSESTDRLLIFDLASGALLHAVPVGQRTPHCLCVAPDGATVYTANIGSGTVTPIDVEGGRARASVRVGERPEGMAFSPDGSLLYVVSRESDEVSVIDTDCGRVVGSITTGRGPVRIAMTPDGGRIAFPLFHQNAVQIADTAERRVIHTIPVGSQPAGTTLSADGKLLFVSCELEDTVYVISMEHAAVVGRIRTGRGPDAMLCLTPRSRAPFGSAEASGRSGDFKH